MIFLNSYISSNLMTQVLQFQVYAKNILYCNITSFPLLHLHAFSPLPCNMVLSIWLSYFSTHGTIASPPTSVNLCLWHFISNSTSEHPHQCFLKYVCLLSNLLSAIHFKPLYANCVTFLRDL